MRLNGPSCAGARSVGGTPEKNFGGVCASHKRSTDVWNCSLDRARTLAGRLSDEAEWARCGRARRARVPCARCPCPSGRAARAAGDERRNYGGRLAGHGGRGRQPDRAHLDAAPRSRSGPSSRQLHPNRTRTRLLLCTSGHKGDVGAAAPISSFGNGSGTPIAVDGQPEWRSADFRTNVLSPTPAQRTSHRLRRALVAGVAGGFCLVTAVVAAVDWRSLSRWQDHSAPRLSIVVLPFTNLSNDPDQQSRRLKRD